MALTKELEREREKLESRRDADISKIEAARDAEMQRLQV